MINIKYDKQKQINDIVSVVKFSSLIFVGIILSRNFNISNDTNIWQIEDYYTYTFLCTPIVIIGFIYCMWSFSNNKKLKSNKKLYCFVSIIEIALFEILFTTIMFFVGVEELQCKLLYLL